uniref:Magnesium transporter NIPA2 n=1 Tax=Bionectria ochroleuca TaxID=29856 RepID=A0A8H7K895_BIOOC
MDFDPMMFERAGISVGDAADRPASHRIIGISLAIGSGFFIGVSFVMKKFGLLRANEKYNEVAGEGYGYLKNAWWWGGMTLMIVGEICNVVAYAFTDAIIVTSLGALTVVIATILSAIFLKERLSLIGKVSCFLCIVGSIVIVMNAPHTGSVKDIQTMQSYVIHPLFLSYTGVVLVGSAITALWAGPKWGNKNMLVYISVCSWVGGLSVVSIQGLGAAVVAWAGGKPQYKEWFMWVLLVFVIITLLVEIVYLNKALNIYNAAMVTPTYYVYFTTTTIVTSAILFRGFQGTAAQIVTFVLGFLTICSGVVLLQLSKAAKDVPDAAIFQGDLDQIQTIAEQEQPESEPKADAIRGAAAIVRRISSARLKMESQELKRLHEEKMMDQMQPINENGQSMQEFEWDGLRRRKTLRSGTVNSRNAPSFTVSPPPSSAGFPASPHPRWVCHVFQIITTSRITTTTAIEAAFSPQLQVRSRAATVRARAQPSPRTRKKS